MKFAWPGPDINQRTIERRTENRESQLLTTGCEFSARGYIIAKTGSRETDARRSVLGQKKPRDPMNRLFVRKKTEIGEAEDGPDYT